jgi:hypothetical protein
MVLRAFVGILVLSIAAFADSAAGAQWTPPAVWKAQAQRPMRAATYTVPAAAGDKEDGECAVFFFGAGQGGGVDANVRRWLAQFEGGESVQPKPKKQTISGLSVTVIEHSGTYMDGGPMMQAKTARPGYRLIGAIVEAPQGNVFFKLTGPAKTVQAAQPAFDKMLQSLKR